MIVILYFLSVACKTVAVLINTSKNFFNYRHMSNVYAMHHLLANLGLPLDDIHGFAREDAFQDSRNVMPDAVYFSKTTSVKPPKIIVTRLSEQYILNMFYLRHPLLYRLDCSDNLIIYMCGHARDGFFKVSDRYFIFRSDIMRAIKSLSGRLSRVLLILDTCQAASLIVEAELPANTCVVSTSLVSEFSYSSSTIPLLGLPGIDEAVFAMYRKGLSRDMLINSYFNELNDGSIKSTLKCYGNLTFRFSDFLACGEPGTVAKFAV